MSWVESDVEDFKDDGVECRAEVHKQDLCICPWVVKVLQDEM